MTDTEKPVKKRRWTIYGVWASLFVLLAMACLDAPKTNVRVALKAYASNQASLIFTACQAYKIEYGTLPQVSENNRLKEILCGDNPRKMEFLTFRPNDVSSNGEMIDPWGTPFRITFDPDSKIHVISAGPDKIFGTPDDITNQ